MTTVALVEDMKTLRMLIKTLWQQQAAQLEPYGLAGPLYATPSGEQLLDWLESRPAQSMRLLLLDYQVQDGTTLSILSRLRQGRHQHPALHPEATLIGWSIHTEAAQVFRETGVIDGFISKHRPMPQFVAHLRAILDQRHQGVRWTER